MFPSLFLLLSLPILERHSNVSCFVMKDGMLVKLYINNSYLYLIEYHNTHRQTKNLVQVINYL